jgi:hypothetical protein
MPVALEFSPLIAFDLREADFWLALPAVRLTHNFRVARQPG